MRNKTWISLLLAQVLWAGAVQADTGATADKMWRLLEEGANHVQAVGVEQAFRDFADRDGKWQRDGLHVSVVSRNGRIVVDGQGQANAATSVNNLTDSTGRHYGSDLLSQVNEWGHGGVEYAAVDPVTGMGQNRSMYATVLPRSEGILTVDATMGGGRVAGYRSNK